MIPPGQIRPGLSYRGRAYSPRLWTVPERNAEFASRLRQSQIPVPNHNHDETIPMDHERETPCCLTQTKGVQISGEVYYWVCDPVLPRYNLEMSIFREDATSGLFAQQRWLKSGLIQPERI